jgi:diaminopimelate epimerase
MSALAGKDFVKMNGLGNEIVIVDLRRAPVAIAAADARAAARQEPYDQLMALYPGLAGIDAAVRIYNSDGSEAGACGNGMRCVASLLGGEAGRIGRAELIFETEAGRVSCWRAGADTFTVDMGAPRFDSDQIPLASAMPDTRAIDLTFSLGDGRVLSKPSAVNMGNPHAVFWVDDPATYDLRRIGPALEHHPLFPERANITLAAAPTRERIVIRTWERGAGLTKACGSAACAAAVAAARLGRTERRVTVALPGGDLAIDWREADDHVLMTGPVAYERAGRFDAALFAGAGAA